MRTTSKVKDEFYVGFGVENRNKLEMIKKIMAIYKKEIGHNWEATFAQTVRIDLS